MNQQLLERAKMLAGRSYRQEIRRSLTTAGEEIYFAACLDLEGCFAQGQTPEDAEANLHLARIDFIYSLLEDGLPVPDPAPIAVTSTAGTGASHVHIFNHKQHNSVITWAYEQVDA